MKTVLITAIGSFSADVAISVCRQVLSMRVIGCDIHPAEWIAQSRDVDLFVRAPKATNEKEYIDFILNLSAAEGIDFLLPSTDVEVDTVNRHRKELEEAGITICLSGQDAITLCRNKKIFAEAVKDIAVTIPSEYVRNIKMPPAWPVIVKPVNGRSSQGLCKMNNAKEYALADPDSIVQPYIEGDIITADVVRHPVSGRISVLPRLELLRTLGGAGVSVKVFRDEKLEAICRNLSERLHIEGCVCFEFILDPDGCYHVLECNPRLSGGVAFSVHAGYDFVKAHFDCFMKNDIDPMPDIPEQYIARKYAEIMM